VSDANLGPALLFCPADRPDRFKKAAEAADTTILDLEDAVAAGNKAIARAALLEASLDPSRTVVRVNPRTSGHLEADLEAVRQTPFRTLMLPKAETAQDLGSLAGYDVIAICETPAGVENARELARLDNVIALTWGAEDLVAALGGHSSRAPDGTWRDFARYARSRILIAAASEGKQAFDTVHLEIPDQYGLRREANDAAASGFSGAMCVHPSQVAIIRDAFHPDPETMTRARAVLAAAANAGSGVFLLDGQMIDEPVLRQARRILLLSTPQPDAVVAEVQPDE